MPDTYLSPYIPPGYNILPTLPMVHKTSMFTGNADSFGVNQAMQGCKIIFLLTRPAGLVGGKTYSPLWYYHSPLRINHICIMYYNILMKAIKYSN